MNGKEKKIRIAILCRGYDFDAWEAECIRQVKQLPFVEIVLLISDSKHKEKPNGFFHKLLHYPYRNFLWRFYKRFRLKIPSYVSVSLEKELKSIPNISCEPELKGKYSQHFCDADIRKIKSFQPDVILRFAFNILRGEILTVAQYGVWSFHHADEQMIRGGPAAFWEMYNNIPVTAAILQRLTEKLDAGIILRKGYFPTIRHSYKGNLEQLLSGTTSWMKQALIDVANGISPALNGKPIVTEAKIYSFPKNFQMIYFIRKRRLQKMKFHFRELFRPEQWNIGIVNQSVEETISNGIKNVEWLSEPKSNEYFADPFGWMEKDDLKIVFENYSYRKQKGILSSVVSKDNRTTGTITTLLDAKIHLSYPFVLERLDDAAKNRVILPEASQSNTVFCFDSANPKNGQLLIKDIPAIDSTPVFHNNNWWIFCTHEGEFNNTNLFLYHAKNFDGPWTAHENNPVKCDVRSSRPGGTPFLLNGKLYRPAQDCSNGYGSAIVINEITELSEISFSEKNIARIAPDGKWKFSKGLHTFSIVGKDTILIDAKRYNFNFDNFTHVLGKKTKRIFRK